MTPQPERKPFAPAIRRCIDGQGFGSEHERFKTMAAASAELKQIEEREAKWRELLEVAAQFDDCGRPSCQALDCRLAKAYRAAIAEGKS